MYTWKTGLAALGSALALLTAPSYGQQIGYPNFGPPHSVIYWDGMSNLQTLLSSLYTDVIVYFVQPDPWCNLKDNNGAPVTDPSYWKSSVDQLHGYSKTVLISFGGESDYPPGTTNGVGIPSANYLSCANNVDNLVGQLVAIVRQSDFDGVDIDFEDTTAFGDGSNPQNYDGISFLNSLTSGLYTALSALPPTWNGRPPNIITHAPQTAYWNNPTQYNSTLVDYSNGGSQPVYAPYAYVWWSVGPDISWFNTQFYFDGGSDPWTKENLYLNILGWYDVPSIVMVMGLPISSNIPGWIADTGDGGPLEGLIATLQQQYPNQFGGIMAWDFNADLAAQSYGYNWSYNVAHYLWESQHPMFAQDNNYWRCLDSTGGAAYVDTCGGGGVPTQYWKWFVGTIRNAQTGLCLDSNGSTVYTDSCYGFLGNPSQTWQVLGANNGVTIQNRSTGQCLDSGQGGLAFICNGGPYQSWWLGNQ